MSILDIWNQAVALVIQGYNDASVRSKKHWHSMVTNVTKNVKAKRDIYTWDGNYLATMIPTSM